jgi:hypothetical protein
MFVFVSGSTPIMPSRGALFSAGGASVEGPPPACRSLEKCWHGGPASSAAQRAPNGAAPAAGGAEGSAGGHDGGAAAEGGSSTDDDDGEGLLSCLARAFLAFPRAVLLPLLEALKDPNTKRFGVARRLLKERLLVPPAGQELASSRGSAGAAADMEVDGEEGREEGGRKPLAAVALAKMSAMDVKWLSEAVQSMCKGACMHGVGQACMRL